MVVGMKLAPHCAGCKAKVKPGLKYCGPACGHKVRNRKYRSRLRQDRQLLQQMREALK